MFVVISRNEQTLWSQYKYSMKKWIELIERAAIGDEKKLRLAAEILHTHMVRGRTQDVNYKQLMDIIARPEQGMTLYRVEPMSIEDIKSLPHGVPNRKPSHFYSWTKRPGAISTIALEVKYNIGADPQNYGKDFKIVVIKKTFPASQIVLDVAEFRITYRDYLSDDQSRDILANGHESEVIVYEPNRVMNSQNTKLVKDSITDRIKKILGLPSAAVNH